MAERRCGLLQQQQKIQCKYSVISVLIGIKKIFKFSECQKSTVACAIITGRGGGNNCMAFITLHYTEVHFLVLIFECGWYVAENI